jgi:pyruvate dehydrogenase E1 component beta subunit
MDTVLMSVAKTGRLLVIDEDFKSFGMSGEVVARTVEGLRPGELRQVRRLCMPDVPLPAAKTLEDAIMPGRGAIAAAISQMSNAS